MTSIAAHSQMQHPIKLYIAAWILLFILSTFSYLVDFFNIEGYLRYFFILLLMLLKASLIVAIFMHLAWERLALIYAILVPLSIVLAFVVIMSFESDYTLLNRILFTSQLQAG